MQQDSRTIADDFTRVCERAFEQRLPLELQTQALGVHLELQVPSAHLRGDSPATRVLQACCPRALPPEQLGRLTSLATGTLMRTSSTVCDQVTSTPSACAQGHGCRNASLRRLPCCWLPHRALLALRPMQCGTKAGLCGCGQEASGRIGWLGAGCDVHHAGYSRACLSKLVTCSPLLRWRQGRLDQAKAGRPDVDVAAATGGRAAVRICAAILLLCA